MNTAFEAAMSDSLPLERSYFCLIAFAGALPQKCSTFIAFGGTVHVKSCEILKSYVQILGELRPPSSAAVYGLQTDSE
ncbi:Bifunctional chorismate mutase/prephenate dehydratase, partial [Frankliniella fusca]